MNTDQASKTIDEMLAAIGENRSADAAALRQKLIDDGWCPDCGMRWHICLCSHEED